MLLVVCRSVSRRLSCEIQEDDSSDDRDKAYEHEPSALVDVVHSSCAEREAWDESGKRQEAERICPTPGMMFNTKETTNIARGKYQNSFLSVLPSN